MATIQASPISESDHFDYFPYVSHLFSRAWLHLVLLLAFCSLAFFYGLGFGELWRTESLRAIIARNMLESGNWMVPTLYGMPLFTKPPGMYAAIALVSWPFGAVTEWTARLPSALAATAVVLLFYLHVRRQLGAGAGLAAALILPMAHLWLDKVPSAEIEMLQVAWVTGSILFFLRAAEEQEAAPCHARSFPWWLLAALCMAGGFLTKWTAPAFFYLTVIPFLWWRGRLPLLWSWPHLVGVSLAVCLCLAWVAAAVAQTGWEVFYVTVRAEALQRLAPGYGNRAYPWLESLTHPLRLLAATLPWSLLALWTLRPGFIALWDERGRRWLQALHCWSWPNMVLWSLMTEHAPRYSAPLFPGIAGLAALVWWAWYQGKLALPGRWLRPLPVLVVFLIIWMVLKGVHLHAVLPARDAVQQLRAKGARLAALLPEGKVLYVFHIKDEGLMFYFGRPVLRLASPRDLPSFPGGAYCILTAPEWAEWGPACSAEVVGEMTDGQGDRVVIVRHLTLFIGPHATTFPLR